ncbi:beta-adaptin-like protein A [Dorcoceras hygrometricum]|uniref:Beta-adaptin-like protein A n=1 Tax=Dorcoceras hygrometricum TaxID=472368 RepID=A0A2Z7BES7_9LAMI|nr:beta-adaptin-like protein A [Dorcoceras hygrometricum]
MGFLVLWLLLAQIVLVFPTAAASSIKARGCGIYGFSCALAVTGTNCALRCLSNPASAPFARFNASAKVFGLPVFTNLRQSGPRPDPRFLRQTALEVLTRSARTYSPRKTRPEQIPAKLAAAAAAHGGGGGGGERRERGGVCLGLGLIDLSQL